MRVPGSHRNPRLTLLAPPSWDTCPPLGWWAWPDGPGLGYMTKFGVHHTHIHWEGEQNSLEENRTTATKRRVGWWWSGENNRCLQEALICCPREDLDVSHKLCQVSISPYPAELSVTTVTELKKCVGLGLGLGGVGKGGCTWTTAENIGLTTYQVCLSFCNLKNSSRAFLLLMFWLCHTRCRIPSPHGVPASEPPGGPQRRIFKPHPQQVPSRFTMLSIK